MNVSVVVPLYNEQDNVGPLCAAICSALEPTGRDYEVVLVDDGSTDSTRERLALLAAENPRLVVVEFRRNYGQTAAMSAGIEQARGEAIVTIDGDLQNDPEDIPALLDKLSEGYDLAHGWRKHRQDAFLSRKLPSLCANRLISWATGFECKDLGCTLKAMRSEIAHDLRLYGEMHRFIPILASWHGARCVEVATHHRPRTRGASKYGISRTFGVVLDLLTVVYMTRFSLKPMRLFGGLGAGLLLFGGGLGLGAVASKLLAGLDLTGNPLLFTGLMSMTIGLQFVLLGMMAEMATRTHYESQGRRPYAIARVLGRGLVVAEAEAVQERAA